MRNIIPGLGGSLTALVTPFRDDRVDWDALERLCDREIERGTAALFAESNPIPVKAALASLGLCTGEIRLLLTHATPATQERLLREMAWAMRAEEHAAMQPFALAS